MTTVTFVATYSDDPPDDISQTSLERPGDNLWRLPRREWQDYLTDAFERLGLSTYGYADAGKEHFERFALGDGTSAIKIVGYTLRSYYWGDVEELYQLPNFASEKHNVEIRWYKYPLRYAHSNRCLSFEEFRQIVDDFEEDVRAELPELPVFPVAEKLWQRGS